MYTKSGRQENLDLARMLAILSVILIHTVEDVEYMQVLNGTLNIPIFRCVLEIIMFIAGRSGVFIFCMLTGALMGNRNIDNIKEHYINRVAPMIITTISWTIIYRLFYFFHNNMNYDLLNIKEGILEIALLNIKISNHLWFMPMIIGIYITMPFINILMKNLDDRQIILFITLNTIFVLHYQH
ncbi:acyltransferase 3 [Clostridium carnis]|uniref:Acyltransferase 3 n=1 Tax=Clostridium carnis TaxID=1530 RepID=A0ABY6SQB6_9CLOT|nr:acyltransferase family protein [Clostridium carnis]VDG69839.1 acyltransferase 3 [Clostridium carnis]